MFLRFLQLLAHLSELSFQFVAALAELAGLLLNPFPTLDLFSQRFGQLFYLLLYLSVSCLQFLDPCLETGLFAGGALLLALQLLLELF